ncbi:methionine ABC transporter ATP-binding protein [Brevibacterium litoralis]|uniref:methionine ABC transporter ATP-binding protein n=1 Tax=Brevibacterium litoralis TaxID=3138935 RepID=UPI0032EAD28B
MIELRDLRKEFPTRSGPPAVALDGVDLNVGAGEIHGIVGRSGAGKSTLIRCLTGLEVPTAGTVVLDGLDLTGRTGSALRAARRNIGMVFQHANLLDSRTALQNVEHPLQIAGVGRTERRKRALELLDLVGLSDRADNHPAQLSGGQKQRVGIARALAARPGILLCDEPTSALDSDTTDQILDLIRRLRDRLGITVVIITHEMHVVRAVCDSVTLLENGRVTRTGALLDVVSEADSPLSRALLPLPQADHVSEAVPTGDDSDGAGQAASGAAGNTLVEVFVRDVPVARVFALLAEAGQEAEVTTGALETIDGHRVGRLHLAVDDPGSAVTVLSSAGVHARLVDATAEEAA